MLGNSQGGRHLIEVFGLIDALEKLRRRLRHDHAHDLTIPHMNVDREQPDVALLHHTRHRFRSGDQAELRKGVHGPDDRMTGEGHFLSGGENAKPDDGRRIAWRKHEDSLGQVHLSGDLL